MEINIIEYGARCDGSDTTPALRVVMEKLRSGSKNGKIIFPQGRYDFWPDKAEEVYLFTSNNDSGLKRIAFNIVNCSTVEIDGQGSAFIFHGQMVPFSIVNSGNITLRNVSIDFKRPFHNEARIVASGKGFVDLSFDQQEFDYEIVDGRLLFQQEDGETFGSANILEFDTAKRQTALMVPRNYDFFLNWRTHAEQLSDGVVRLFANFDEPYPKPGNTLVFGSPHRNCPGIFCDGSSDLKILDVVIHHAGGMGLLAQRCDGVHIERLSVTPSGKRMVSTSADATHFVNCKGEVRLIDCLLENQMDDPTNVHGIYTKITKLLSPSVIEVRLVHPQQRGFFYIDTGDVAEVINSKTLLSICRLPVRSIKRLNREYLEISFDGVLAEGIELGDALGNASWIANLTIRGCTTRGNRARGFLISTPGRVIVENNLFHNEGPAILIEGDANYWFESGEVRDVIIRENTFFNCNYGYRGVAVIQVTPGVSKDIDGHVPYHRNLCIEDNRFMTFSRQLVYARCVMGLSFERNMIESNEAYPCVDGSGAGIVLDGCKDISIFGNKGAEGWPTIIDGVQVGTLENFLKV